VLAEARTARSTAAASRAARSQKLRKATLLDDVAWIAKMQTELQGVPEFRPTEEEFADQGSATMSSGNRAGG
jgi:hypothetical protein